MRCPACNSEMRPVGAGPCPTCGQDSDAIRALFPTGQEDRVSEVISTIPTAADGVTCHIEDVRKALAEAFARKGVVG